MKKSVLLLLVTIALPILANASNLQEQLTAVARAEAQGKAEAAAKKHERQQAFKARLRKHQLEKQQREQFIAKQLKAQEAEWLANKKREQNYQDELRKLDLERKKLELQQLQTRVNHEDDFIKQALKHKNAETDLIQSNADANRHIAKGTESYLQNKGEAEKKKASGLFN